ncbi:MAG: 3-dehydroquinate dehydratase / shikimate dehydrogenase [Acidobacteriota bacterium]|nr:3-dehydroquinate dehydratase / shikimate dehydrogenase [Acidobacteriota bacterium]
MTAINNSRALVCVPVCVRRASELPDAIERAAQLADVIELRFDCLADDAQLDDALRDLRPILKARTRPFISTFRPAEQGGARALDKQQRLLFWIQNDFYSNNKIADYADIELDLLPLVGKRENEWLLKATDWERVICSHHDFVGVPADLEAIYERMTKTPARILKIAVQADEITDCIPVLRLLERARSEGREMIAIAMGEAGLLTRVLAPAFGSFLTYGSLDDEHATAPGQVTVRELRDLYCVHSITERTLITGLVGSPVAHSVSPHMHNAAFAARGIDAVYIPFETRDARAFVRRMAHTQTRELVWNLRGFSVTAPHKGAIMDGLDFVEPAAREIGAVNTVVCEGNELHGYNTDADAALAPLDDVIDLKGARVAVIGAGGAARSVLWSLRERGARATVFARDIERARAIGEKFDAKSLPLAGAQFSGFDAVINATPLGTRGAHVTETAATSVQLRGARVAYDLVYNPSQTRFLSEARAAGCETTLSGLAMLVAQAAAQFKLWTGADAPVEVMKSAAEERLMQRDSN